VSFKYDPFGRRIQKSSPSETVNYLYDGYTLLEEVDNSGNLLARYTQSNAVDESLSVLRASTTSYYEADGLGSVTSLSNSAGVLANTRTYDSFGKLTASAGTLPNPFQFTGREFDQETGTYYYRMRYYDSDSGRFISEDPSPFDLEWPNLYLYVKNRPTGLIDPFGLSPQVFGPWICTWCAEFGAGSAWMWEGYERMKNRNWQGDDKYYHCMANCRATNVGSGGATAAKVISFFRTDVSSRIREPNDWRNDDKANKCGQQGGNCDQTCAPFLPHTSPGKPPFPGW
jgi:RHS repeat-associated protein